jgi:hypothetical protein
MTETIKPDLPNLPALKFGSRPQMVVPETMEDVWRFANLVHRAKMFPAGMDSVEAICIAILHGAELGIPPLMAVQRLAVINGRPTIPGELALAVVRARGLLEEFNEVIEGTGDAMVARCTVKRKGEDKAYTSEFSVEDAKVAGLWDERATVRRKAKWDGWSNGKPFKAGDWIEIPNDAPWKRFPKRMLVMRARGFRFRDSFTDVLGGLYISEEMMGPVIEGELAVETAPPHRMSRMDIGDPPEPPPEPIGDPPEPMDEPGGQEPPTPPEKPPEPPEPPEEPTAADDDSTFDTEALLTEYAEAAEAAQTTADLDEAWALYVAPVLHMLDERQQYRIDAVADTARQRVRGIS